MKGSILSARITHLVLIGFYVLVLNLSSVSAQRLYWLGTLNNDPYSASYAFGVSDNGVVVGEFLDRSTTPWRGGAFRWTAGDGIQDLGTPGGRYAKANDISADGSIVVGEGWDSHTRSRAFKWTANGGMQTLFCPMFQSSGTSENIACGAYCVSASGSVIVGFAVVQDQACGGFGDPIRFLGARWDSTTPFGYQSLDFNPGTCYATYAYGASVDGSVIVGQGYNENGHGNAFRWTNTSGIQALGTLGGLTSSAYDVSADGRVIVGTAHGAGSRGRAFRWTEANGMQDLGELFYNDYNAAQSVSGDGSVIVGSSSHLNGTDPFRWTAATGMQNLNQLCAGQLRRGSRLLGYYPNVTTPGKTTISPNGRYIVGYGYNSRTNRHEAYLIDMERTPPPVGDVNGDDCVNDIDLLLMLFQFGTNDWDADLNGNNVVDDTDLLLLLFNFGNGC